MPRKSAPGKIFKSGDDRAEQRLTPMALNWRAEGRSNLGSVAGPATLWGMGSRRYLVYGVCFLKKIANRGRSCFPEPTAAGIAGVVYGFDFIARITSSSSCSEISFSCAKKESMLLKDPSKYPFSNRFIDALL